MGRLNVQISFTELLVRTLNCVLLYIILSIKIYFSPSKPPNQPSQFIICPSVFHGDTTHVVVDLPLLRVAVEGSDNPISLEKPCQASLPPDQQGHHSLGTHPEVQYAV